MGHNLKHSLGGYFGPNKSHETAIKLPAGVGVLSKDFPRTGEGGRIRFELTHMGVGSCNPLPRKEEITQRREHQEAGIPAGRPRSCLPHAGMQFSTLNGMKKKMEKKRRTREIPSAGSWARLIPLKAKILIPEMVSTKFLPSSNENVCVCVHVPCAGACAHTPMHSCTQKSWEKASHFYTSTVNGRDWNQGFVWRPWDRRQVGWSRRKGTLR